MRSRASVWLLGAALLLSALIALLPANARWQDTLNRAWAPQASVSINVAQPDSPGGAATLAVQAALYARAVGAPAVGLLLPPGARPDPVFLSATASPSLALGLQPHESAPGLTLQVTSVTLGRQAGGAQLSALVSQGDRPSLGYFLAEKLGALSDASAAPRPLRALGSQVKRLSLNDLAAGRVSASSLSGGVLILDGSGVLVQDERGERIPLGLMQARAVTSFSLPPLRPLPLYVPMAFSLLLCLLAWWLREYWGFALALLTLALSAALYVQNFLFPGVLVSFGPLLGALAVGAEGWLGHRPPASTDSLTLLGNRNALLRQLERLWLPGRSGSDLPLAVLVLDLDDFSNFNSQFGRPAGDRLLREVAATLRREQRGPDVWFRWGADEFVLVMPHAEERVAQRVAERILRAISTIDYQGALLSASVGFSAGVMGRGRPGELLDRASRAMQRQKYLARGR